MTWTGALWLPRMVDERILLDYILSPTRPYRILDGELKLEISRMSRTILQERMLAFVDLLVQCKLP
jgi:hypothetical protein